MTGKETKSKMLFVAPAGTGGIQTFCADLGAALYERGHDVHIFFEHRGNSDGPNPPVLPGITVGSFFAGPFDNQYHVLTRMTACIRGARYDVVYPNTSSVTYRALGLLGVHRPVAIGACHGDNEHDFACNTEFAPFLDHIFAVSGATAAELQRRLGVATIGVTAIPLGLRDGPATCPTVSVGPLQITFAGRLVAGKRVGDMIEVVRRLCDAGVNLRLRIVGDGPLLGELTRQVEAGGLNGCIEFTGFLPRTELDKLWKSSHLTLQLSESEGFGLSALEAMRFGCVPIVTSTCGCREAIREGRNGFVVQLGDVAAVVNLLRQLDVDRDRVARLAVAAMQTVREDFSFDRELAGHLTVLRLAQEHHRQFAAATTPWIYEPLGLLDHPAVPNWLARGLRKLKYGL